MFTTNLSKHSENLTYSERKIANLLMKRYIEEQESEVLGSEEIAKNVECGQSTVIRFSQKLGYSSYRLMILDLIKESLWRDESKIEKDEPVNESMIKLQQQYNQSIIDVMTFNTDENIDRCVELIEHSKMTLCYGLRGSYSIASALYYRLRDSGMGAFCTESVYDAMSILNAMDENDVVVIISISGETKESVTVAQAAKKRNVKIISITGNQYNTVYSLSTVTLVCAELDLHIKRFNLVNRCSLLYLVDIIFLRLWHKNEEKMIGRANELADELSEFRHEDKNKMRMRY